MKTILYVLFFFFLLKNVEAQSQFQVHFVEAERLAEARNFETAFALIATEAEVELNCHAVGNYWLWCLQYGKKVNDSTYEFPTPKTEGKAVFGKLFYYVFKEKMQLERILEKCPHHGKINEALGYKYYLKALQAKSQEQEEQFFGQSIFHLRKALRGGANDTLSNFYLAQGLEYQAKLGEAIRYYQRTYGIDGGHIQSLLKIGACFGKLNEWDSCLYYAEMALQFANTDIEKATAIRLKAESQAAKGNPKVAKKLFKQSVNLVPGNYDNTLAYIDFLYQRKKGRACKEAIKLLKNNIYHRHIHIAYKFMFVEKDRLKIYDKVMKGFAENSANYKKLQLENLAIKAN